MDLLGERPVLSLADESWRIYSRQEASAPQYIGAEAVVSNSTLTAGCEIYGTVRNSVLGAGVRVEAGALVEDSVLMENVVIGAGATVKYAILDSGVEVGAGATVGEDRATASEIAVVGADIAVPAGKLIEAGAMISKL